MKNVLGELFVLPTTGLRRSNADMGFVDAEVGGLRRAMVLELVDFGLGRVPEACVINRGDVKVLRDATNPSWEALDSLPIGQNHGDLERD